MTSLDRQCVVLVHGLGAPAAVMRPMQRRFERVGYATQNFGYRSLVGPIEQHGSTLAATLRRLSTRHDRVHLVTHSMGGIVARCAVLTLASDPDALGRVGRIVMLAPPNRGSPVATRVRRLAGRLCPPAEQLSQHEGSWIQSLAPLPGGVELGVIAAAFDWIVGARNTHLPGQADHVTLAAFHGPLVWHRSAFAHALHFIRHGRFTSAAPRPGVAA